MSIQEIANQPFDRFGPGYHSGQEFMGAAVHVYFNADGYSGFPTHLDSEADALLLIQILRTAIKVAYEVDPSDPVGALNRMCEAHYMADIGGKYFPGRTAAARDVPGVEAEFLHGVRPPAPLPMITADQITSGSLAGPDPFKDQRETAAPYIMPDTDEPTPEPETTTSCSKSCGPSDYTPGGKCDQNGCYEHPVVDDYKPWEIHKYNPKISFGYSFSGISCDMRAPGWIRKICCCGLISNEDTATCIRTWLEMEQGMHPGARYRRGDSVKSFFWLNTPQGATFWNQIHNIIEP